MKKRIVILVVSLIAITGIIVGVSYAFFSIGGSQEQANTFTSGCLNISLTNESTAINLTNTYPITDIEGLEGESYDFTIKNTCTTETNYSINLESLNKQTNSLSADYIKVALSSDTVDHVISKLSDNTSVTPEIDGSYESYNLYTGTLKGSESKTYHLKLWIDYDATKEEAANKTYSSKINVIANPETTVVDTLEAKFGIDGTTVTSRLTEGVTSASYCTTTDNICEPNTSANISNNSYSVKLTGKIKQVTTVLGTIQVNASSPQMVCTKLNGTSKVICSNSEKIELVDFGKTAQASCSDTSKCEETNGIYESVDDWGTSYYYRGAVNNNWVKFAGFYWRIIRINGDGSIRLIYNGTSTATTGESTQIGTSTFNSSYNDNAYVGYMYGSTGASSYAATHANTNNSTIKEVLDNWYQTNIASKGYGNKVSTEAGFCGDREPSTSSSTSNGSGGTGTTTTYYGGYIRLVNSTKSPTLKCKNSSDLYTVSGSGKGNKALSNPVGLITADEISIAGGLYTRNNSSYYLYTNQAYCTMSPLYFPSNTAEVFFVNSDGGIGHSWVNSGYGVRPVINLAHDVVIKSGNGSSSTPYEI